MSSTFFENTQWQNKKQKHENSIKCSDFGGSNDLNFDKDEPTIDHITEFIKTNNHTNSALANVPIRYALSYYSQVNKGIQSYNKKLMEITK